MRVKWTRILVFRCSKCCAWSIKVVETAQYESSGVHFLCSFTEKELPYYCYFFDSYNHCIVPTLPNKDKMVHMVSFQKQNVVPTLRLLRRYILFQHRRVVPRCIDLAGTNRKRPAS